MAQCTSYVEGTPNWVELHTGDPSAAQAFYGGLFGWKYDTVQHTGSQYCVARMGDDAVAGITDLLTEPGTPPTWATYLAVTDLAAAISRVEPAGGRIIGPPSRVGDAALAAVVADPTGAVVGLWEAAGSVGATVVNEPGALIWNELMTDDVPAAARFYESLVGLGCETTQMKGGPYTTFQVNGRSVAGATARTGESNYWHVYFAVEDAEAAAGSARSLGGDVVAGPLETAIGPMAMLRDPHGAAFSVFQLVES